MSRQKPTTPDFILNLDRLSPREQFLAKLRKSLFALAAFYGFEPIHTPPLEPYRLFAPLVRDGVFGERIPFVMRTREGVEYMARISGAISALRMYGSHRLHEEPHPLKFIFEGDTFMCGGVQGAVVEGTLELGLVMIGEDGPVAEAEILQVLWKTLGEVGISDESVELKINAVGCSECRPAFRSQFASYLRARAGKLCKNCKRSLKRVPTRILLCDEEKCKTVAARVPQVLDFLCERCKKHLRSLLEFLDEARIPYFLDPRLFKEDSWFGMLVFEICSRGERPAAEEGSKTSSGEERAPAPSILIAEGGRLSHTAERVTGKPLEVAAGSIFFRDIERFVSHKRAGGGEGRKQKIFLVQLGELAKRKSLGLLETLRAGGVEVRESLGRDSIKSQLKVAERIGARIALILGQKEALDGTIIVREVQSGIQETISQDKLVEVLKQKLKK